MFAFELKAQKKVGSKSSENGCVAQIDQPNQNKPKSDRKMRSNDFEQGYCNSNAKFDEFYFIGQFFF